MGQAILSPVKHFCYSCAGICESESRHALSFSRRQTQHSPSAELGAHSLLQTVHKVALGRRSSSMERLASASRASGIINGSGSGAGVRLRFTVLLYQGVSPAC